MQSTCYPLKVDEQSNETLTRGSREQSAHHVGRGSVGSRSLTEKDLSKKKWTLVVYGLQFLGNDNKPFILLSPWLFGIIMLLS